MVLAYTGRYSSIPTLLGRLSTRWARLTGWRIFPEFSHISRKLPQLASLTDEDRDPPGVGHVELEPPLGGDVLVAGLDDAGAAGEGPGHVEAHDVHPEGGDEEEVVHEGRDEHADRVGAAVGKSVLGY